MSDSPLWVTALAKLKTDADAGVGDTARRILQKIGGEKYKALRKAWGIPCLCGKRQDEWNRLYPYS